MSDGNLPIGKEGHPRPTCRLVSLTADSRQASAQTNDKQTEVRKVAIGVVMVTLLGLACMGVVFTLKHRQLRSESQAGTKLVQSDIRPVAMPVSLTPASKPKLIPSPPNTNGAEVLTVLPRTVQVENANPLVVENKQRPEAVGETTREPGKAGMSVPEVSSDKPPIRPSNLLPETPSPHAPR